LETSFSDPASIGAVSDVCPAVPKENAMAWEKRGFPSTAFGNVSVLLWENGLFRGFGVICL
jgi:hypothetical protein